MLRITVGVVAGFIAWLIVWVGSEKGLSAIWPAFGVHQRAFEEVVKNGGQFTADTTMLLTHIAVGSVVSVMAGALAALIAGDNTRDANSRICAAGLRHIKGSYVVATCSDLVSRSLHGNSTSNGGAWR